MKIKLCLTVGLLTTLQLTTSTGLADKSYAELTEQSDVGLADDPMFRDTLEASIIRGDIVFSNYCTLCHGNDGDGKGRAARLYDPKPANLIASNKPDAYFELIIRRGGALMGRSEFMPAWEEELTEEQIEDVVTYLRSINEFNP